MRRVCVICAALVAMPASAADTPYLSLNQYRSLERGAADKATGSPVVTVYLGGALEALGIVNAMMEKEGKPAVFCATSGLSAEILRRFVNEYLSDIDGLGPNAAPTLDQINVSAAVTFVLRQKFPCR